MSVNRVIPTGQADGTVGVLPSRTGPYGEAGVQLYGADNWSFADEGSAFAVANVTPGTAVTSNAAPVAATSLLPFFHIFNSSPTKTIFPKFAWVRVGTAPSGGATTTNFLCWSDASPATTWSSGGVVATQVNMNSGQSGVGGAVCRIGALVIIAVSARKLWHVQARSVIAVIQDTYYLTWGSPSVGQQTANITSGTLVQSGHIAMPPMAIAPLTNWSLSIDGLSQSGAGAYELSLCYVER